jgi:DNA polymerase III subunit epsilon
MGRSAASIIDQPIQALPISVVDIETTGLYPGGDRLLEISIVRIEPGHDPKLVLDTLVNPRRRVSATEIHGITDDDVKDAPAFEEIAGDIAISLKGSVLAAYNVYFDMRFLEDEFGRVGFRKMPPYLCLMYMRPLLGLGSNCCLEDACRACGIQHDDAHRASSDAMAGAHLWSHFTDAMNEKNIVLFRDLSELRTYKFLDSFKRPLLNEKNARSLPSSGHYKPRSHPEKRPKSSPEQSAGMISRTLQLREYWDILTSAVADLELTQSEIEELAAKRKELNITSEELRTLHGRVYAAMLSDALADSLISDAEWYRLKRLHQCLKHLGWAPGM